MLYTGKDFVIIDFEGEPARPLGERRHQASTAARRGRDAPLVPLRGVHRAVVRESATARRRHPCVCRAWVRFWYGWVSAAFLAAYLEAAGGGLFLPATRDPGAPGRLLLEKALYELRYELNNRPEWVHIPIQGILQLLDSGV